MRLEAVGTRDRSHHRDLRVRRSISQTPFAAPARPPGGHGSGHRERHDHHLQHERVPAGASAGCIDHRRTIAAPTGICGPAPSTAVGVEHAEKPSTLVAMSVGDRPRPRPGNPATGATVTSPTSRSPALAARAVVHDRPATARAPLPRAVSRRRAARLHRCASRCHRQIQTSCLHQS